MKNQRHSIARGFTIIELLVATAITALLMTLMVTIITGVTKSWNSSSGKLTSGGQARLIMDQITKDLQCAIFRADGNTWMAANVVPDTQTNWFSGSAKPASESVVLAGDISQTRFGQSGVWLRFFTTQPGTNQGATPAQLLDNLSAPVAVSYRLMYTNVGSSSSSAKRYMLYRGQVTPPKTFAAGYNINDTTAYPLSQSAASGNVESVYWPAKEEVLAENVVDFGIRMYVKETIGTARNLRLVFPSEMVQAQYGGNAGGSPYGTTSSVTSIDPTKQQTYHFSKSGSTPESANDYYANTFPDVIEVMMRVLSDEGARQLDMFEHTANYPGYTVPSGTTWWSIVEANSTVYTRRIEINAKAF